MDVRDLAIGDWVKLGLQPYRVVAIIRLTEVPIDEVVMGVEVYSPATGRTKMERSDAIQSIPFTFDFMEKNGFKRVDGTSRWQWYFEDTDDFRVVAIGIGSCTFLQYQRYLGDGDWNNLATMTCYGVNGMQRFFSMAGIDKEIKI